MKDFLKLFKTIMDFKGLLFLVTKQSTIKKLRLLFFGHSIWQNEFLAQVNEDFFALGSINR